LILLKLALTFAASQSDPHDASDYVMDTPLAEGFDLVRFPRKSLIDRKAENLKNGIPLNEEM